MALLEVNDLTVRFGDTAVVDNISFAVERGTTMALVGESGSGKSLTARSILGLQPPSARLEGRIEFDGTTLLPAEESLLRQVRGRRISMIFQEPMSALNPLHTIGRQIAELYHVHQPELRDGDINDRVIELLHKVGVRDPEKRLGSYPHQLSGGQRQRAMIAMALANAPDLLIADEPTTALDVSIQAKILDLLQDLQADLGMTMLFITHDLGLVRHLADDVCVMRRGLVLDQGAVSDVFDSPRHEYTKALLNTELPKKSEMESREEVLLNANDIKVWFPIKRGVFKKTVDHVRAVNPLDIELYPGETVGVVGESGSGKSTLGLALLRLLRFEGKVTFAGQDLATLTKRQLKTLRSDIQIVFQDPFSSLSPRMTVESIIAEGLDIHQPSLTKSERLQRVIDIMEEVAIDPDARHRYPHEFSGGQRQRISIARAMILRPRFVVLDEPTSALDVSVQQQLIELLLALQEKHNLAYLFISHDLDVVRAMSDRIIVMRQGNIVEQGNSEKVFTQPEHEYTKMLLEAISYHRVSTST